MAFKKKIQGHVSHVRKYQEVLESVSTAGMSYQELFQGHFWGRKKVPTLG